MREKYIDELIGVWVIFGSSSPNLVDISDGVNDIIINTPRETAEKLVLAQENFRKELYRIFEES